MTFRVPSFMQALLPFLPQSVPGKPMGTPARARRGKNNLLDKRPRLRGARTLNVCNAMPNHALTLLSKGKPNQFELERRCHAWFEMQEQRRAEANAVQV